MIKALHLFLLITLFGCRYFLTSIPPSPPANVEVVVSRYTNPLYLSVSPKGDKIAYEEGIDTVRDGKNSNRSFLLNPKTQQTDELPCFSIWLDNWHFYCDYQNQVFSIDSNTFEVKPQEFIHLTMPISNVTELLDSAQEIYPDPIIKLLWLIRPQAKPVLIDKVEQIDTMLEGYTYTVVVPTPSDGSMKKVYSPDKAHYFNLFEETLKTYKYHIEVYDAKTNQRILTYEEEDGSRKIFYAAWAEDSRGIYFHTHFSSLTNITFNDTRSEVLRLNLP